MSVVFSKKSGTATISVEKAGVKVLNTTESVEAPVITGPVAHVNVGMGCTVNIGNYSNVKMYVGLTYPCSPSLDVATETCEMACSWVEDRLEQVHDRMLSVDDSDEGA